MAKRLGSLKIADLIDLVASDHEDIQKLIDKAYEWEHTRKLEAGKWFLATGTAALIGALTLLAKEHPPAALYVYALSASGAFAVLAGATAFSIAGSVSARLARVSTLIRRLQEVQPFLKISREQDGE